MSSVTFKRSSGTLAAESAFRELELVTLAAESTCKILQLRDLRKTLESLESAKNIPWRDYARTCADIWNRVCELSNKTGISMQAYANYSKIQQLFKNREIQELSNLTSELYKKWVNSNSREFAKQGKDFQEELNNLINETNSIKVEKTSQNFNNLEYTKLTLEQMRDYKTLLIPPSLQNKYVISK